MKYKNYDDEIVEGGIADLLSSYGVYMAARPAVDAIIDNRNTPEYTIHFTNDRGGMCFWVRYPESYLNALHTIANRGGWRAASIFDLMLRRQYSDFDEALEAAIMALEYVDKFVEHHMRIDERLRVFKKALDEMQD